MQPILLRPQTTHLNNSPTQLSLPEKRIKTQFHRDVPPKMRSGVYARTIKRIKLVSYKSWREKSESSGGGDDFSW